MVKDERAKLWFGGKGLAWFEHEVVPHDELHPKLRKEVDGILADVNASRVAVLGAPAFLAVNCNRNASIAARVAVAMATGWPVLAFTHLGLRSRSTESPDLVTARSGLNFLTPYLLPAYDTKRLGKLIKSIADGEEAPFGAESSRLMRDYQYGVVDNAGNLVLLKHPLDRRSKPLEGWQKLKRMAQWNLVPHRVRFELNKPVMRQKATEPTRLPANSKPAFAVPFRFARR